MGFRSKVPHRMVHATTYNIQWTTLQVPWKAVSTSLPTKLSITPALICTMMIQSLHIKTTRFSAAAFSWTTSSFKTFAMEEGGTTWWCSKTCTKCSGLGLVEMQIHSIHQTGNRYWSLRTDRVVPISSSRVEIGIPPLIHATYPRSMW